MDKNYSYAGRDFATPEEMHEYALNWPNDKADLYFFSEFLFHRLREAHQNVQIKPDMTNRELFEILHEATKWVENGV